jgi:glucokinase
MMNYSIGIDIGGTNIKGVLICDNKIQLRHTIQTHDGIENWQEQVKVLYDVLSSDASKISSVGLSAPGIANKENGAIAFMPGRLQGLENYQWSNLVGEKVYVLNDAHAALWAEAQWGVGKGIQNIVMVTLGTGVGGGLLIGGQLHQGFLQRAGHLGHIVIDGSVESPDITGITGSLEDAVGEATLESRSRGRYTSTFELVNAYVKGDHWATHVWLTAVRKLALGIASLCNTLSPDLVILAGGITKAEQHLLEPLSAFLDVYEWRPGGQSTPVKIAEYQDYAGAIGAALYANKK